MSAPAVAEMPRVAQLGPRRQMAVDCTRCARRFGTVGHVLGVARHRGRLFQLWICEPCAHRTPLAALHEPPPGAGDRAPGTRR
ncbi:hypothetical protein [Streptomyces sp. NL15-2K]|uniref:hypothetical protein n=1 Tax=Streptomyces sp. NL15-2K TaxID=376149 RepID=UPI000F56B512|nr:MULTISPECIES: hypothetical protein [Actinomycetes]WKX09408.1 hypothetical protein Q4V64_18710 [Kutzneria buriramensis]